MRLVSAQSWALDEPASHVRYRAIQICAGATERNVTVGTHEVLTSVLHTKLPQHLTIIDEHSFCVIVGEMPDSQHVRKAGTKLGQPITVPSFDRAAEKQVQVRSVQLFLQPT